MSVCVRASHYHFERGCITFPLSVSYPLDTLIGARSALILRPKSKHGEKEDFAKEAGRSSAEDYDTFMTLAELC